MIKKNSRFDYVITANFSYGPFKTKKTAIVYKNKIAAVNGVLTSAINKVGAGYKFSAKLRIGCREQDKIRALKAVKSGAPNARVTISKA